MSGSVADTICPLFARNQRDGSLRAARSTLWSLSDEALRRLYIPVKGLHRYLIDWLDSYPIEAALDRGLGGTDTKVRGQSRMTDGQTQAMERILSAVELGMLEFPADSRERECFGVIRSSLCEVLGSRRLRVVPDAQQLPASESTRRTG